MYARDSGPCDQGVPVTKSDTVVIPGCRALFVGTAGNLTVQFAGLDGKPSGTDVVFKNVANGQILPICPLLVRTATTAADIVAIS